MLWRCFASRFFVYRFIHQACAREEEIASLTDSSRVLLARRCDHDPGLGAELVQKYLDLGALEDARRVFYGIPNRNVFSWTKLMAAFNFRGAWKGALLLFSEMQLAGVIADKIALLTALRASASIRDLEQGRLLHRLLVERGYDGDPFVGNSVLNMYNKCCSLDEVKTTFDQMKNRDVVSWTLMISAFAQHGQMQKAFEIFKEMRMANVVPSRVTFLSLLGGCTKPSALPEGTFLHEVIQECGLEDDIAIGTSLVTMYGKCGSVLDARKIFDGMKERDRIVWNSMMATYCQHACFSQALQVFQGMNQDGIVPDVVSFITILTACATPENLHFGKLIHACAAELGCETHSDVGIALVNMYGKCESLDDASRIFGKMPQDDPAMWNALLCAFSQANHVERAFHLFQWMLLQGVTPDKVTLITMMNALARPDSLQQGMVVHGYVSESSFHTDVFLGDSVLNMYSKCGSLVNARTYFDKMSRRDIVSWNIMIAAYCENEQESTGKQEAVQLYRQMMLEGERADEVTFASVLKACAEMEDIVAGKQVHSHVVESGYESNVSIGNTLVNLYGKCGPLEDMKAAFDKMARQHLVSWTAIISSHAVRGRLKDALRFFHSLLLEGMTPDKVTFVIMLSVCGALANLVDSRHMHALVLEAGTEWDNPVANAIITMYSKCGSLVDAYEAFEELGQKDIVSWNTMVSSFAQNGHSEQVLKLFGKMQQEGVKPDRLTFISVLAACSHAGLAELAFEHYVAMSREYSIAPTVEHEGCIIDLLGKLGRLDEAEEFITKRPSTSRDPILWITLLSACRVHGSADRGQRAAERALERDPKNSAPYVVLSNIYSAAGRWDDVAKLKKLMEERGLMVQHHEVGRRSWIHLGGGGKVHEFVAGDESHPRNAEVYAKLEELNSFIKEAGYEESWQGSSVMSSEKLAVAFGLVSNTAAANAALRVVNSDRITEDSHAAIKFISKVTSRDIDVRDNKRLHRFRNGVCSCQDYW